METSPLVVALFTGSHDKHRGSLVQNIRNIHEVDVT